MPDAARLARLFCLGVGPALVVGGIVGLAVGSSDLATGDRLPTHDFGPLFAFNGWHHVLHLATGLLLLAGLAGRRAAAAATLAFGAVYAVLTPLAVLDGDDALNVVYSDMPDNFIHLTLAVLGLAIGLAASPRCASAGPDRGRSPGRCSRSRRGPRARSAGA
jgi:hypothetical protein